MLDLLIGSLILLQGESVMPKSVVSSTESSIKSEVRGGELRGRVGKNHPKTTER